MTTNKPVAPKVFMSYSHDSPEHADRVLILANRLLADGVDCILDQYESTPPEGWPRWMDKHIRQSDFVLMVCTEIYCHRVMGTDKPGTGLGVRWEGNLIYQHIYNAETLNTRFIPVLFDVSDSAHIPTPMQGATHYLVHTNDGYEDLYRRITNQPHNKKPTLGKLRQLPVRERKQDTDNKSPEFLITNSYCFRCGAKAGTISECTGFGGSHTFKSYVGSVFCARCGAQAGKISECTSFGGSHTFKSYVGSVFCTRCGAQAGEISECTSFDGGHSFKNLS